VATKLAKLRYNGNNKNVNFKRVTSGLEHVRNVCCIDLFWNNVVLRALLKLNVFVVDKKKKKRERDTQFLRHRHASVFLLRRLCVSLVSERFR